MSEASTTGASEADQSGAGATATGAAADGSSGGTQAAVADSGIAEQEAIQAEVRSLQSARDKLDADIRRLRSERESLTSAPAASEVPASTGLAMPDLMRVLEIRDLRTELKDEFGEADPALFKADPLKFESGEAYRLAVARSHEARKEQREKFEREAEERVRARYAEKYGPLGDETPAPATGDAGVVPEPTPAQIAAMSITEQMAFEEANPGVIDRVLAKHSTGGLISSNRG